MSESFNRVEITLQFPEDKWQGHEQWTADAELLLSFLRRLFPPERRGDVVIRKSYREMEDG